jgi:ribosomal protein S6
MEVKIESRIGKLESDCTMIYSYLSDCNNFKQLADASNALNWQSSSDWCTFTIDMAGDMLVSIVERKDEELLKYSIENDKAQDIYVWVQFKNTSENTACIKITMKLETNIVTASLIKKPLKTIVDNLVETIEEFSKRPRELEED